MKESKLLVNSKSSSAQTSIVFMLLAAVFILMGTIIGTLTKAWVVLAPFAISNAVMIAYFVLPLLATVLFAVCVLFFGKKAFYLSAVPVLLAAVSTMIKAFQMGTAPGYIELILCVGLVALYACTALGMLPRGFFVGLTVIILAFHTYFAVYTDISTSTYRFSQLFCEIGILFLYVGFIFAVCGATRQRTINPKTATTVAPPIPGGYGLGEIKNSAVSAPEPVVPIKEKEEAIPIKKEEPVVLVKEEPAARKYYTDPIFSEAAMVQPEEDATVVLETMPVDGITAIEETIPVTEAAEAEAKKTTRKRTTTKNKTEEVKE